MQRFTSCPKWLQNIPSLPPTPLHVILRAAGMSEGKLLAISVPHISSGAPGQQNAIILHEDQWSFLHTDFQHLVSIQQSKSPLLQEQTV